MANKINVYFNEYNLLMGSGGVTYLPFVSGILSANAKKIKQINENFSFKKFIFEPLTYENLINKYYTDKPDIAVFSISMWNEQLSLKVAKKLKEKWNTLIIFGGAILKKIHS
jgi:putative methyltransferase